MRETSVKRSRKVIFAVAVGACLSFCYVAGSKLDIYGQRNVLGVLFQGEKVRIFSTEITADQAKNQKGYCKVS